MGSGFIWAFFILFQITAQANDVCHDLALQDFHQQIRQISVPAIPGACLQSDQLHLDSNPARRREQVRLFNQCERDLFKRCYPKIKPEISEETLQRLYSDLRNNPLFRSAQPRGQCERRAYLINKILTEQGYQSERIFISAPAIIGNLFDNSGAFVSPLNYRTHTVAIVKVKTASGGTQTMVLDPQFAAHPTPMDEYFRAVTGQSCRESNDTPSPIDMTCSYRRVEANYRNEFDTNNPMPSVTELYESCGWSWSGTATSLISNAIQPSPEHSQIPVTRGFRIDPQLGRERSAFSWGLEEFRRSLVSRQTLQQRNVNQIERVESNGTLRYFLHGETKSGEHTRTEITQATVDSFKEELRQTSDALNRFEAEKSRILRMDK